MLCLGRFTDQAIIIDVPASSRSRRVRVKVARIAAHEGRGGKVRLAFDADPDIAVNREEVHRENTPTDTPCPPCQGDGI